MDPIGFASSLKLILQGCVYLTEQNLDQPATKLGPNSVLEMWKNNTIVSI